MADADKSRERAHQLSGKRQGARAAPTLAKHEVQREGAPIAEADQHEPARIKSIGAQLPLEQRLETPRRAIEHDWIFWLGVADAIGHARRETIGRGNERL